MPTVVVSWRGVTPSPTVGGRLTGLHTGKLPVSFPCLLFKNGKGPVWDCAVVCQPRTPCCVATDRLPTISLLLRTSVHCLAPRCHFPAQAPLAPVPPAPPAPSLPHSSINVTDGEWHMVTLTTQPSTSGPSGPPRNRRGTRLYIDGLLAGQVPGRNFPGGRADGERAGNGATHHQQHALGRWALLLAGNRANHTATLSKSHCKFYQHADQWPLLDALAGPSDPTAEVNGGDPITLGGPLLLCGHYSGSQRRCVGATVGQDGGVGQRDRES